MKKQTEIDWQAVRSRAAAFPDDAFNFVRDGLKHTVKCVHGSLPEQGADASDESRHVSGQQLCHGMRDLAVSRYGLLARTVLNHWGIRRTDDFGTIVYALIDRGELRCSSRDSIEDFREVFEFADAFSPRATA